MSLGKFLDEFGIETRAENCFTCLKQISSTENTRDTMRAV